MIGEIGGSDEELAAKFIERNMSKRVVGFVAGRSAPKGKRMGHAGAIVSGGRGTAEEKIACLAESGVKVASTPVQVVDLVRDTTTRYRMV